MYGPRTLDLSPHTFLHCMKISGVKTRSVLKKSYLFHELEDMKSCCYLSGPMGWVEDFVIIDLIPF